MQTANGVFVWRYLNVPQNWAYVNSYWSWVLVIATMVPEFIYPFVCKSINAVFPKMRERIADQDSDSLARAPRADAAGNGGSEVHGKEDQPSGFREREEVSLGGCCVALSAVADGKPQRPVMLLPLFVHISASCGIHYWP